ncbi:MAG: sigma-70 family RNA polymerase sigma factor [Planctomycetota bacterium]
MKDGSHEDAPPRERGSEEEGNAPRAEEARPDPLDELARGLRRGDDVVGDWFARAWPLVHRLCRGFTASGIDADDVAQDAMVHLYDHIQKWDPERSYAAWQRAVVLNHCRNQRRAANRRRAHEDAAGVERVTKAQTTPPEALEHSELGELVDRFLSMLPPREREAFVLCDLEGMRPVDAAEVMGVADSTVRAALTLGRRRMKDALQRAFGRGGEA